MDSCSGPPRAARSRVGPSIKFRGFGDGAYTHVGAWARRTYKGLDMGWGFGIVAAVFRLVCCDEAPGVDLFCLRGFSFGERTRPLALSNSTHLVPAQYTMTRKRAELGQEGQ